MPGRHHPKRSHTLAPPRRGQPWRQFAFTACEAGVRSPYKPPPSAQCQISSSCVSDHSNALGSKCGVPQPALGQASSGAQLHVCRVKCRRFSIVRCHVLDCDTFVLACSDEAGELSCRAYGKSNTLRCPPILVATYKAWPASFVTHLPLPEGHDFIVRICLLCEPHGVH